MPDTRYFLPDHPDLTGDYSREDLRLMLQDGKLSRSDMVLDDQTGLAHLLGALLASPYHLSPVRRKPPRNEDAPPSPQPSPEKRTTDRLDIPPADEFVELPDEEGHDEAYPPEETEEEEEIGHPHPETGHVEFRAVTPLRQRESTSFEVDHYGQEEDEEEDYYDEGEDDEEEDEYTSCLKPHGAEISADSLVQGPSQDEETLLHGHPSWLSYRRSLLGFLVLAGVSIAAQRFHFGLAWCVTAAALALLCLAFIALDRMMTEYWLTTRRVEVIYGLFGRNSKEIRIADIRAIDVTQTGLNALFGVGTVEFYSSAGEEADVCFENVSRPHRLKKTVRELQG